MNHLRLFAELEATPSEQEGQAIEAQMQSLILRFAPSADLTTMSGEGSWWIVVQGSAIAVGGWLALQFASWVAKRGFDYLADEVAGKPNRSTSNGPVLPTPIESSGKKQRTREQVFAFLASLGSDMSKLAGEIGADRVVFGEWSEHFGTGHIIVYQRGASELALGVIQTDSRDDFDSRTLGMYQADSHEDFDSHITLDASL